MKRAGRFFKQIWLDHIWCDGHGDRFIEKIAVAAIVCGGLFYGARCVWLHFTGH